MGKFQLQSQLSWDSYDWGTETAISSPVGTSSNHLMIFDVILSAGEEHSFHRHPNQEEVIYMLAGEMEQWIGDEKHTLVPGDSAFIEKDEVHASFNRTDGDARFLAVLGPCIGDEGYETVELEGPANSAS
jgi:quercetin dioxygenase-like cupin family protein